MKKFLVFGMMSALALAFTACSSEEELVVNPTFDGQAVKTEFALNLPGKFMTRQTEAVTQDAQTVASFRGIDAEQFYLYAMQADEAADADPVVAATPLLKEIDLGAGLTGFDHTNAQDKWYFDVAVPVNTNAFLVYANSVSAGDDATNGVLNMTTGATPQDITFGLQPINEAAVSLAGAGEDLLDFLNDLVAVEGLANADATEAKAWYAFDREDDNMFYADLFTTFSTLTAGSKTSVEAFLTDLKATIEKVPVNAGDNGIDKMLLEKLDEFDLGDDFTADANIPDGAAVLKYDATKHEFSFDETVFIGGGYAWGPNDYVFPAALWYRVNTGIREDAEVQSQNVQGLTWKQFINTAYQASNNAVKASSQSIALVNPLQYAVGNFETQIKFADENMLNVTKTTYVYKAHEEEVTDPVTGETTTVTVYDLDDEGNPIIEDTQVETTKEVPISGLELTGILVGDQKGVDWQALPIDDNPAQVIYDTKLINTTFGTEFKKACQTLVLETTKESINVALEFVNNTGIDFTGVNGQIIPDGTKFYLIGQLKIKTDPNWTEETDGKKDVAIFQQDYKTIAKFTINSLIDNAYNIVPDLRTPELEFGLSVDLEWQKGYTFEIGIGEEPEEEPVTPIEP